MPTATETVVTSRKIALSCMACGDTIETYQPVPVHSSVWCGRECCFWIMLDWQPEAQWRTYATVGGFKVMRQEFESSGVIVTMVEPTAKEATG